MATSDVQHRAASVSFRQLRLFESIGRLSSVRAASEECNLTQPAVTQALAKFEEQVGARLIERRASGSYLNELGSIFHRRAQRLFALMEKAMIDCGMASSEIQAATIARRISRSQIRSLLAALDSGSFDKAAEALDLSHKSLQRAARDLQSNLRKPLFYRTAEGMMVTPAGTQFALRMKVAMQEIESGLEEIDAARGRFNSRITMGALPSGGSVLLASVLDDFVGAYPEADVRIVNENATEMFARLRKGEVDFVIGLLPECGQDDIVTEAFAATPYQIVGRRGHSLLRKGHVTLEDLLQFDWVVGTAGSSRRTCFDRIFAGRASPNAAIATSALPIIHHLLTHSDRLTLMTSYELMHEDNALSAIPFGPIEPVPSIGIMTRPDWLPTPMHKDCIALVRERMLTAQVRPVLSKAG